MLRSLADMDLRLLRVFDTVARCGGFAAAQSALNLTQANISMQMKQLEERPGVTLRHRGRTGFWLTDEGKTVLEASQVLFRSIDEFRSVVSATAGTVSGRLHLSVVDNSVFNEGFNLARAIRRFKAKSPNSELVINVTATNDVEQMAIEHDMGFVRALRCHTCVMHRGRIIAGGDFGEIERNPRVRDVYLARAGDADGFQPQGRIWRAAGDPRPALRDAAGRDAGPAGPQRRRQVDAAHGADRAQPANGGQHAAGNAI